MMIDTHCHLDFERFDEDRDQVVARALAAGVMRIIVPAIDLENCGRVLALADRYPAVYAAVGIHPNSTQDWQDSWIDKLTQLAQHPKVVAIGEIGLDYYWDKSPHPVQHQAFSKQLELAASLNLPVIVHNRESDEDVLKLLAESPLKEAELPGVLHSFSSPQTIALQALEMGYFLGFTGPLTFKKADQLRSVAAQLPLDRVLIETDAPFLTPHPYRGRRNEPAFVSYIGERLALLHQMEMEQLCNQTSQNAFRLFSRMPPVDKLDRILNGR